MDDITEILKRLKQARKQAGVTQTMTAVAMGCNPSHICDLEKGKHPLTLAQFLRLCEVYSVEPSAILAARSPRTR